MIPIDGSHKKDLSSDAEDFYRDYWKPSEGISEESFRRHTEMIRLVFEQPPENLSIGEVGIGGEGGVLLFLKDKNKVTGFDVSETAVSICQSRGIPAVKYNADVESLPAEDNSFDTLFACEVFEHFGNPQRALEEVRRVVKPGGLFAVSIPHILIHHWPRFFYPSLIERVAFREFLLANRFFVSKELGIGQNIYHSTTQSPDDVWSWFWVCENVKADNPAKLVKSGIYFLEKKNNLGVRTHAIEAGDLFRLAYEQDPFSLEAASLLTLALVYRVINGEREEFISLFSYLKKSKEEVTSESHKIERYLELIENELGRYNIKI